MLNRIQKLILHEYREFDETLLVESPFAEVTAQGIGIRQVEIGITLTKLIIAADNIPRIDANFGQNRGNLKYLIDPEIENLELISIIPLSAINLKVYYQSNRQILRILLSNKSKYFEFGGYILRNMFWSLWRDRIRAMKFCKYIESVSVSNEKSGTDMSIELNSAASSVSDENETKLSMLTPKVLKQFIHNYNLNWSNGSSAKSSYRDGVVKN